MTTPERWARIERIFQQALAYDANERQSFLDDVCEDDEALRREVESLLAHDGGAAFLSTPAVAMISAEGSGVGLNRTAEVLTSGARIGPYEIQHLVGIGGWAKSTRRHTPRSNGCHQSAVAHDGK